MKEANLKRAEQVVVTLAEKRRLVEYLKVDGSTIRMDLRHERLGQMTISHSYVPQYVTKMLKTLLIEELESQIKALELELAGL